MEKKQFYKMGETVRNGEREGVLIRSAFAVGVWVSTDDFNRISDETVEFTSDGVAPMPAGVYSWLMGAKEKNRFVDLFRYVRPLNKNFEIDNMKGITFRIQLDYKFKTIKFAYSVCNGDNFEKQTGRERAQFAFDLDESTVTIPMKNGTVSPNGVLRDIWEYVKIDMCGDIVYRQMMAAPGLFHHV